MRLGSPILKYAGCSPDGGCDFLEFRIFSKSWMHYKGKIQNQSYLKNYESHKKTREYKKPIQNIAHLLRWQKNTQKITWKLWTKSVITQKNKKRKNLIFHSIQHIPHLSCKDGHFWEAEGRGEVCISLVGKKSQL